MTEEQPFSKEYFDRVMYPLRTWWDRHPDRSPADFGIPEKPYGGNFEGTELDNLLAWEGEPIF